MPASFALVVSAFARDRSVTRGKMFSSSNVPSVNGKIFAMLVKGKLVVNLPKQRVDELVVARVGAYFDPGHGRLMKQWISISPGRGAWVELAKDAYDFVRRPPTRSRPADFIGSVAGDQPTADRAHEAAGALPQKELRQTRRKPQRGRRLNSQS